MKRLGLALLFVLTGCNGSATTSTHDSGVADASTPPPPGDMEPPPDLTPAGSGALRITVIDNDTGLYFPSRVIITAVAPTKAIQFDFNRDGTSCNGEYAGVVGPGVLGAPEGVLLEDGAGSLHLPAGTYDVFITHGPEWEADERRITLTEKQSISIDAVLDRTVDTTGWMATDLHVHTGRSFDSHIPEQDRVVSLVTVGIEIVVATDHNVLTDLYAGRGGILDHGYDSLAMGYVGDEFNFDPGHGGAYPMPYDPNGMDPTNTHARFDGGALKLLLDYEHMRFLQIAQAHDFLGKLKERPAITVNHPRLGDLGFFNNLYSPRYGNNYGPETCVNLGDMPAGCGWHPPMPLAEAGKFDAVEIMSGYMHNPDEMRVVLRDWFFLLSTGVRVTGLGSSDTHRLRDVKAGFPRTWLRMPTDDPQKLDRLGVDLGDAIRSGRAVASNGPFVTLKVNGAEVGDTVKVAGKSAAIDLVVDAPGWIDLDTARIFINGKVVKELPIADAKTRPRLRTHIDALELPAGDCWIAAQVGGKKPLPVALIGEHEGGSVTPFAITSPVYVDRDGDGQYDPRLSPIDADPGPIGPVTFPMPILDSGLRRHELVEDCEPPLWAEPAKWVNP